MGKEKRSIYIDKHAIPTLDCDDFFQSQNGLLINISKPDVYYCNIFPGKHNSFSSFYNIYIYICECGKYI